MRLFASISLVILLSFVAFGQSAEKPSFEIADVHSSPPSQLAQLSGGVPRNGRYELRNASMVDLVRTAYNVPEDRVFGGPNWVSTDRFDVIAKIPANTTPETAKVMLQALLADRFGLKVHDDKKPVAVFVLSAGKGRHKLKPGSGDTGCQPQPGGAPQPGVPFYQQMSCHNLTSDAIAQNLHDMAPAYLDKPVVDETKLEGNWDFDIKWTGRGALAAAGADGISIFDAVDKQLGLKLEPQQRPLAVIVVDSVNRKPTDNLPGVAQSLPPEKPQFETSEIKPSPPGTQGIGIRYNQGGRIDAMGTLRDLIAISHEIFPNLAADYVVGPKFIETSHFTIVAKAPSAGIGAPGRDGGRETAPPLNVALMMMRSMLEDRFKLKTHNEDRPTTVYAISVKGEAKMKKAAENDRAGCRQDPGAVPQSAGSTPMVAFTCTNTTMDDFVKNVAQWAGAYFDHPAINTTGLQGGWNFSLYWTPRGALDQRPANAQPGVAADPGGFGVFEAIEKQLGLKVDKGTHPLSVIVVDHAEEKPVD